MRKLTTFDEATESSIQHKLPCHDCPFDRESLPGWLAGMTPQQYRDLAHSDAMIECHAIAGPQCAGAAIYRANVCKLCRDADVLSLPANRQRVFATPMEFVEHHERLSAKKTTKPRTS